MNIDYFAHIAVIHQRVREFVETHEPMYKVTSIDGYATTYYLPTLESQNEVSPMHAEFILSEVRMRFRVSARYLSDNKRLSCDVYVTSDGKLYLADQLLSR